MSLIVAPAAGYAGYLRMSGNIHAVDPGLVYRSGQLDAGQLEHLVDDKGIRSVLNLRGPHPGAQWFEDEADVAQRHGITHLSIHISADKEPRLETMAAIEQAIETAPKPLLIHCMGGADRSGLASAIYEYAVAGKTAALADDQLSFTYGHFPWLWSRSGAMDRAFQRFVTSNQMAAAEPQEVRGSPDEGSDHRR
ncbi:tyrosine-protein phosphatase [Rhodobium orientis]|nr:tyrosine-protein phosphatase [Rhodobium orientis]